ncbi:radical SAM protein [Candidatus Woesearchaeota archaeon]|nr:radical SAM protein [Candidatus Woesearchaeota archaeon]
MKNITVLSSKKCNNRCLNCPIDLEIGIKRHADSFDFIKNKIKSLNLKKDDEVTLSGGEPTINKAFIKIVIYLQNKFNKVNILTNGRLLSNSVFLKKIQKYFNKKKIFFHISLYSTNPEINNKLTRSNSLNQTLEGIKKLSLNSFNFKIRIPILRSNSYSLYVTINKLSKLYPFTEFVFIYPDIMGELKKNKKEVLKINDLKILFSTFDYLINNNIRFFIYHLPFCLLPYKYWGYLLKSKSDIRLVNYSKCLTCHLEDICPKISKTNKVLINQDELTSFSKKDIRDYIKKNGFFYRLKPLEKKIDSFQLSKVQEINSSFPDVLAVSKNIKPLTRISFNSLSRVKIIEKVLPKDILLSFSKLKILHNNSESFNINDPRNGLVDIYSKRKGTIYGYLSKSSSLLEFTSKNDPELELKPSYNEVKNFASNLGYPSCCVEYWLKKENIHIDMATFFSKEKKSFLFNNFLVPYSNYYLSFHHPCSYECKKTLLYNKRIYNSIKKYNENFGVEIKKVLTKPLLILLNSKERSTWETLDSRLTVIFNGIQIKNKIYYYGFYFFEEAYKKNQFHYFKDILLKSNNIFLDNEKIYFYLNDKLINEKKLVGEKVYMLDFD